MAAYKPNKYLFSLENLVQFAGLLFSIFLIAYVYTNLVRPRAEQSMLEDAVRAAQQTEGAFVPKRDIYIIVKDYEQQICFTLMLWASIMVVYKLVQASREKRVFGEEFFEFEMGERIIPEEAMIHANELEKIIDKKPFLRNKLLSKMLFIALQRFHATESVQTVSQSVQQVAENEGDRLDSDLSLIRYIAWAIPSVGFIGTVRGIGQALTQADEAIKGDISGVTASLGLAFNSTLIALFLSIILMYFVYLIQSRQENLIHEIEEYCREKLIAIMKTPFKDHS